MNGVGSIVAAILLAKLGGTWVVEAGIRKYIVGRTPDAAQAESRAAFDRPATNLVIRIDERTSLDQLNAMTLNPGTRVLFKRGGVWRGQIQARSGRPGHPVVYGAYGEGEKPIIEPSYARSRAEDWKSLGNGLWQATTDASADIGNVILEGKRCAFKRDRREQLAADLDFWCNPEDFSVIVKSAANPAARFKSIELAEKVHCIDEAQMHDVIYDGLHLRYSAAHGIGGSGGVKRIVIRNCDISWIGGGFLYYDLSGRGVRYGNGIEFWGDAEDVLIESNRVWECWDAGLTNQSNGDGVLQRNLIYRGNEVWNCEYSFEYWQQGQDARTENVQVIGNRFRDAGGGWGHGQRWNPNAAHLMLYDTTAATRGFTIASNVFARTENCAIRLFNAWYHDARFRDNEWDVPENQICRYHGRPTHGLKYRYPDRLDQTHDDNQAEIESQTVEPPRVFGTGNEELRKFRRFIGETALGEEVTIGEYAAMVRARVEAKIGDALRHGPSDALLSGTVTYVGDECFFVQREDEGMKVIAERPLKLPGVGETVCVSGAPTLEGGRVLFRAEEWHGTGRAELPAPRMVSMDDLVYVGGDKRSVNWLRVSLAGRAIGLTDTGFAMNVDGMPINIMMARVPDFLGDCDRTHPKLVVKGVAELLLDQSALTGRDRYVMGVKLDVVAADDVRLVADLEYLLARKDRRVMWMTLAIMALLAVGLVMFVVVIIRQQRRILRSRTVMAERKRMADDIHDTIEQHLVGAGMLLKLNRMKEAQDVLVRAKREIRDIVWGLKNDDMMRLSPSEMLRKLAHEETAKGLFRVDTKLQGMPEHLEASAMRDLSLIVRETIGNAVKHGGAKKIAISSDPIEGGGWKLRIANDGEPFDPEASPGASEGHFGIEGMRQRAFRLGATIAFARRKEWMVMTMEVKL